MHKRYQRLNVTSILNGPDTSLNYQYEVKFTSRVADNIVRIHTQLYSPNEETLGLYKVQSSVYVCTPVRSISLLYKYVCP